MPSSACRRPPRPALSPYTTLFRSREDWVGTLTLVLLLVAAFAALMLLLRELIGFSRLNRLNRIRADIARAIADRDAKRERKAALRLDRKSTRLNSSHLGMSYAVFCLPAPAAPCTLSLHDPLPISRGLGRHPHARAAAGRGVCGAHAAAARADRLFAPQPPQPHPGRYRAGDRRPRRQARAQGGAAARSEEHTSELQSLRHVVCRLLPAGARRALHSLPTRPSSDLARTGSAPSRSCCCWSRRLRRSCCCCAS